MHKNVFVTYGSTKEFLVVTKRFLTEFVKANVISIPKDSKFNRLFTDPSESTSKFVNVYFNGKRIHQISEPIVNDISLHLPKESYGRLINSASKPIYIYYHICCIGNRWPEIIRNTISFIRDSGLYDKMTQIKCYVLGQFNIERVKCLIDPKIVIVESHPDKSKYERYTLNNLWDDSNKESFYALYLHTKGVIGTSSKGRLNWDWINDMLNCTCNFHKKIIILLQTQNTVGTRFKTNTIGPHYSGNFWWSTSNYIKSLDRNINKRYLDPEAWLLKNMGEDKHINITHSGNTSIIPVRKLERWQRRIHQQPNLRIKNGINTIRNSYLGLQFGRVKKCVKVKN